jgi:cell division protein FtsW (lipid II flippase)
MRSTQLFSSEEKPIIVLSLSAALLGVLFIFSAGIPETSSVARSQWFKQCLWIFAGIIAFLTVRRLSPSTLHRLAPYCYLAAVVACAFVLWFPGIEATNGAKRWISVGPFQLQPGEFAKPAMIWFFAWVLSLERPRLPESWRGLPHILDRMLPRLLPLFAALLLFALIEMEPDLGTAMFAALIPYGMLLGGGAKRLFERYGTRVLLALTLIGFGVSVWFVFEQPYRLERFTTFNRTDSREVVSGSAFQTFSSKTAIAVGGISGLGPGRGHAKYIMPAATTDFIYTTMAEEFGIFALVLIVVVVGGLCLLLYRISIGIEDTFGRFVVQGTAWWIGLQTIGNLMMATGMAPPIGVPLPFFSYGGSSLIALAVALGGVCSAVRAAEMREASSETDRYRRRYRRARLSRS